jgi:hypothetical protein
MEYGRNMKVLPQRTLWFYKGKIEKNCVLCEKPGGTLWLKLNKVLYALAHLKSLRNLCELCVRFT